MSEYIQIVCFSIVFFVSLYFVFRVDLFYSFAYLFLYIYTIFTQFGYTQRPEYSSAIQAYFGSGVFPVYFKFICCCFALFFLLCIVLARPVSRGVYYHVVYGRRPLSGLLFVVVTLAHWGLVLGIQLLYGRLLNYDSVSNDDFLREQGLIIRVFIMALKFMVPSLLLWYYLIRINVMARLWIIFWLSGLTLFLLVTVGVGNRTDLLALFLGIMGYEIFIAKTERKLVRKVIGFVPLVALFVGISIVISELRSRDEMSGKSFEEKIVVSDYYAPSHMLLAAIEYDYIDPLEVVSSNINNALILRNYPYLQAKVAGLFRDDLNSRSAGYGFYLFTEGYIFCGFYGFIYSAVFAFLGFSLWRGLSRSDSSIMNGFMLLIVFSFAVNFVRGQSAYFVKCVYTYAAPSMILFYLATGLYPVLRFGRR